MARAILGKKGMTSAVKGASTDASVVMLAESYDRLVRDLEYILSHLSEENFQPEALARMLGEGD
ncbi:MAG: hypothetical protein IKW24_01710 [Clostridia bacterium]|nr:hypothetical protein [Clostridia bacterium]